MSDQRDEQAVALHAKLVEFTDFLNEPPQYEDMLRVRDYRHEAYGKWVTLVPAIEALRAEVAEKERECRKLGNHAVAIEESVNRLKAKGAAEHKDHLFCPHCNPCRRAEKINEANARATAAEAALAARTADSPQSHDEAKAEIARCIRQIQMVADAFDYDQSEWLADNQNEAARPAEDVAELLTEANVWLDVAVSSGITAKHPDGKPTQNQVHIHELMRRIAAALGRQA